jgi:hypothetical protein
MGQGALPPDPYLSKFHCILVIEGLHCSAATFTVCIHLCFANCKEVHFVEAIKSGAKGPPKRVVLSCKKAFYSKNFDTKFVILKSKNLTKTK